MVLKTRRLTVRPVAESDWRDIKRIWESFQASAYACYDKPNCTEDGAVRQRIARWAEANRGMEHVFFAVCLGQRVIGYIACNKREDGYELGYCFHSDDHGNGYAGESHRAVLAWLHSLGVKSVYAGTALANTPSVALLRSLGFRLTDTEKVSFYQDGQGNPILFDGGIFRLNLDNMG